MGTGRAGVAPGMVVVDRGPGAGAKHGVPTPARGTVVYETQKQRGRHRGLQSVGLLVYSKCWCGKQLPSLP